jgi:NAD-dependent dihydropyrimidine dehydrogenase PreA subunit
MSRPVWLVSLIEMGFPGRFALARLTRVPVLRKLLDRWLFEGDDIVYLPRERVISVGRDLGEPSQTVLPSQIVHHFIDRAEFHWIMNFCICRESSNCRDYPATLGCLFLGKAVLGINPKMGRLVSREEAHQHARKCRDAGLFHLVGKNKLDTVWLGVGPGDRLLTICNCCPCCCLWRFTPYIDRRIASKITRMPGISVRVTDQCTGCGTCSSSCFIDNIGQQDGRSVIGEACLGCGNCVETCPNGAIVMVNESGVHIDEVIRRLEKAVTVQ